MPYWMYGETLDFQCQHQQSMVTWKSFNVNCKNWCSDRVFNVTFRGVARLFKMRGRQGGGAHELGGWPRLRMAALHIPLCHFIWGGWRGWGGGWASDWRSSSPHAPSCYAPVTMANVDIVSLKSLHYNPIRSIFVPYMLINEIWTKSYGQL